MSYIILVCKNCGNKYDATNKPDKPKIEKCECGANDFKVRVTEKLIRDFGLED